MVSSRKLLLGQVRSIHFTYPTSGIISWLKRTKQNKVKDNVESTKELISRIEDGGTKLDKVTNSSTRLSLSNTDFIGVDKAKLERLKHKKLVKSIPFNRWMSSKKLENEKELDLYVLDCYKQVFKSEEACNDNKILSEPFPDLISKFKFTKLLQSKTGYMIPDYQITKLRSPFSCAQWYRNEVISGKLEKFNEAEPNAIDLSNKKFPSNVLVREPIKPRVQRKIYNKILHEVETLEKKTFETIVEASK